MASFSFVINTMAFYHLTVGVRLVVWLIKITLVSEQQITSFKDCWKVAYETIISVMIALVLLNRLPMLHYSNQQSVVIRTPVFYTSSVLLSSDSPTSDRPHRCMVARIRKIRVSADWMAATGRTTEWRVSDANVCCLQSAGLRREISGKFCAV